MTNAIDLSLLSRATNLAEVAGAQSLVYRELQDPAEIVDLFRLRHRVYFSENHYGRPKALGLDLTAYDARSRMFGVFAGTQLVGGVRFVFRYEQRQAPIVRALRAVAQDGAPEQTQRVLPSEECCDLDGALGALRDFVDLEAGRFVVLRPEVGSGMVQQIMIATLAVAYLARCRLYLYTCSTELAQRYARVTNPRWQFEVAEGAGIEADAFEFPKRSVAAVAAVEDSPFLATALQYARALEAYGAVELCAPRLAAACAR